jgi:tetratricopeptide (TPR) repeat protein
LELVAQLIKNKFALFDLHLEYERSANQQIKTLLDTGLLSQKESIRLKKILPVLEECNKLTSLDQQLKCEQRLRQFLLDSGFSALAIDPTSSRLDNVANSSQMPVADEALLDEAYDLIFPIAKSGTKSPIEDVTLSANDLQQLGNQSFNKSDFKSAIMYYEKALQLNGNETKFKVTIVCNKTLALLKLDTVVDTQLTKVLDDINWACKEDQTNAKVFFCKGKILERLGRFREAFSGTNI